MLIADIAAFATGGGTITGTALAGRGYASSTIATVQVGTIHHGHDATRDGKRHVAADSATTGNTDESAGPSGSVILCKYTTISTISRVAEQVTTGATICAQMLVAHDINRAAGEPHFHFNCPALATAAGVTDPAGSTTRRGSITAVPTSGGVVPSGTTERV